MPFLELLGESPRSTDALILRKWLDRIQFVGDLAYKMGELDIEKETINTAFISVVTVVWYSAGGTHVHILIPVRVVLVDVFVVKMTRTSHQNTKIPVQDVCAPESPNPTLRVDVIRSDAGVQLVLPAPSMLKT